MKKIETLVQSAIEDSSDNYLTIENVKDWLLNFLQMHNEEIKRFEQEKDLPYWDLLAADYDTTRDAMFILAFFHNNGMVTFVSGRGKVIDVHDFAQNSFPKNPSHVITSLANRFWIANRFDMDHDDVINWLNS